MRVKIKKNVDSLMRVARGNVAVKKDGESEGSGAEVKAVEAAEKGPGLIEAAEAEGDVESEVVGGEGVGVGRVGVAVTIEDGEE